MEELKILVMLSTFVMLLLAIFGFARATIYYIDFCILLMFICLSVAGMIAANHITSTSSEPMELPYVVIITVFTVVALLGLICGKLEGIKDWLARRSKNNKPNVRNDRLRR